MKMLKRSKQRFYRFVVALDAATNPKKYRKEYLKKLYKLMIESTTSQLEKNVISLFVDYASGKLTKPDLVDFIRNVRKKKTTTD